ncbi:hypothetical protein SGLAU_32640 (plasmid) [Streptomyces glaucescens]|uniref:Uncharacterized protein n=1 Tax=Streptomyces glaucescens TaxID=1907 RepID=A0A089XMM0_STRGA|nr:hypothetical protein SGLAU_32640 [Streptomyces glaucescens]
MTAPAPAGMVPGTVWRRSLRRPAPRARGDGPGGTRAATNPMPCSPRPRGWSSRTGRSSFGSRLLPAPAGMVPGPDWTGPDRAAAPRARGDGPAPADTYRLQVRCSPRPRGWSRVITHEKRDFLLLPAPAGMVPR